MLAPPKENKVVKALSVTLIVIALSIFAFFAGFGARSNSIGDDVVLANNQRIDYCVKDRLKIIHGQNVSIDSITSIQQICSRLWYDELMLDDFTIRRIKFIEQSRDGHVLLWVVVVITLSGVALAALQLAASFQLALSNKNSGISESEITIEEGKLSLKSSIVGLFILLISLGFFTIFVKNVYTIKEIGGVATEESKIDRNQQIEFGEVNPQSEKMDDRK